MLNDVVAIELGGGSGWLLVAAVFVVTFVVVLGIAYAALFGRRGAPPPPRKVPVTRSEPPRASMTDAETTRAVALIREGLPISEAARTVYPDFDRLDEASRVALESSLQAMAKTR